MNRESIPDLGIEAWSPSPLASRAFDAPCAVLSWGVPLAMAAVQLDGAAAFGDDVGIVRDLGFARVGSEGVLSTLLAQLAALLPLGGLALRASLVGVLALALSARLYFGLLRAALDRCRSGRERALHPLFALLGSAIWALGPSLQAEATHIGGCLPAVALLLLGSRLGAEAFEHAEARTLAGTGIAFGATFAESHAAGVALALTLGALAAGSPRQAWTAAAWRLGAAGAGAFLLLGSLRWFWPASAPALPPLAESGALVGAALAPGQGVSAILLALLERLSSELGTLVVGLALCGAAVAAWVEPLRRSLWPWALALGLSAFVALGTGRCNVAPLDAILASLALTSFLPAALQALVRASWASPLPLGRPAAVLTLTFAVTLVLSRADAAWVERSPRRAVAAWTEEAFGRLPPDSVLLVDRSALAFRLLASRTLHDTRPDVLLVPAGLLTASSLGGDLQRSAPSASPLLRQLWVNGAADEYSLSRLADERPVFLELDPNWDSRLLEHLRPDGLWFAFSTAALGPSERRAAASRSRAAVRRVLELAGLGSGPGLAGFERARGSAGFGGSLDPGLDAALDAGTRRALADALAEQALVLAALGDSGTSRRLLTTARRIEHQHPASTELWHRLGDPVRGRVAVSEMLE